MQAKTARFCASMQGIGRFDRILRLQWGVLSPEIPKSSILAPQRPKIGGMSAQKSCDPRNVGQAQTVPFAARNREA